MDAKDLKNLTMCTICGAAVAQAEWHRTWHRDNGDTEPDRPRTGNVYFT